MTMEQNDDFALANATLENEVKLTCGLEETPAGKRIRMEFRNQTNGPQSMKLHLLDNHLNYVIESKEEADRLISHLIGLANKM
ncbi:MAG: hypothetical protein RBR95_12550 [Ignavibacteriaceae bacterium]|nr:hypothetical protein [Ignavibacteriaceae bacterium]